MAVKCQNGKQFQMYIYIHIYIYKLIIKLSEPMYHNFHIYKSIQYINTYCNFKINFEF